ncbi:MAG: Lrp/AsnC ligand binding domain-containing protein [Candidatus Thorarchaeota archaeon]|jgi:DNA-binding Lrp family transcriptional regulator
MSVTPGEDEKIVKELIRDKIIQEAWLTTGEFDVFLVMKGEDTEEINHYVNDRVRGTEGVIRAVVTFGIQSITHDA